MLDGVPNFSFVFGYTHTSWTLKVGLVGEHFCRLLAHMDAQGHTTCYPERSNADMPTRPFLEFGSGYVQRAIEQFPRQGTEGSWRMSMDYRSTSRRCARVQSPTNISGSVRPSVVPRRRRCGIHRLAAHAHNDQPLTRKTRPCN